MSFIDLKTQNVSFTDYETHKIDQRVTRFLAQLFCE